MTNEERVAQIVAQAPPLTGDQKVRIAALLRGGVGDRAATTVEGGALDEMLGSVRHG